MKKIFICLFILIIGLGLIFWINGTEKQRTDKKNLHVGGILGAIKSGSELKELNNSLLKKCLLNGKDVECYLKTYQLEGENGILYFIGISRYGLDNEGGEIFISSSNDDYWIPWVKFGDMNRYYKNEFNENSFGNRPMALSVYDNKLLLTVLDNNGGGSGDGVETVLELTDDLERKVWGCFDYNNWGDFEVENVDYDWYSEGTTRFDELSELLLENCKNNVKIDYR